MAKVIYEVGDVIRIGTKGHMGIIYSETMFVMIYLRENDHSHYLLGNISIANCRNSMTLMHQEEMDELPEDKKMIIDAVRVSHGLEQIFDLHSIPFK